MRYTVNRVLAMIKTTKERINSELSNSDQFIVVAKGQEDNIRGVSINEIERNIQGRFDKVNALIDNYIKLKSAVIKSNVGIRDDDSILTTIQVAGKNITMAELIDLRDVVYGKNISSRSTEFKVKFLNKLKQDYATAKTTFDFMQKNVDEEIANYIKALTGNKKDDKDSDGATKATLDATADMLHKQKDPKFVDPLKIAEKIEALEAEIRAFQEESDAEMSTQNALTTIEVDLNDVN